MYRYFKISTYNIHLISSKSDPLVFPSDTTDPNQIDCFDNINMHSENNTELITVYVAVSYTHLRAHET